MYFLNSICFLALLLLCFSNNIIPIVIGNSPKAKYEAISPSNSFLYYCDFNNTSELVKELKELNTNDTSFQHYQQWSNEKKGLFKPYVRWYCQVCGMLIRYGNETITVNDIDFWR